MSTETNSSNPVGRPTKYNEGMPQAVHDCLAAGRSITQFAAEIGVARSRIYEWAGKYSEFQDALTRAQEASQAFWEARLVEMMTSRDANAALIKLYFANRFGWRDKSEHEVGVSYDRPDKIEIVALEEKRPGLPELYRQLRGIREERTEQ